MNNRCDKRFSAIQTARDAGIYKRVSGIAEIVTQRVVTYTVSCFTIG